MKNLSYPPVMVVMITNLKNVVSKYLLQSFECGQTKYAPINFKDNTRKILEADLFWKFDFDYDKINNNMLYEKEKFFGDTFL